MTELDLGGGDEDSPIRMMSRSSLSPLLTMSDQKSHEATSLLPIVQVAKLNLLSLKYSMLSPCGQKESAVIELFYIKIWSLNGPTGWQKNFQNCFVILQAQRERFRKRNEELEEEQTRLTSQLLALQGQVSDLQTDNVKLYEKIRFLQGFQVTINSKFHFIQRYSEPICMSPVSPVLTVRIGLKNSIRMGTSIP